jgi:hypothetical protein
MPNPTRVVPLFYIKNRILKQKKNYENSNILHHAKIYLNFKKNPLKETKILQDIITL